MTRCILLVLLAAWTAPLHAQRTHDITLDDYFTIDVILQQQIAPDARHVAYTLARWDKGSDGRRVDLWVVNAETKKSRRLTFDHAGIALPRWSSDGKTVYFLARRKREGEKVPLDGTTQVWRVGVEGGEPFAVTRVADGVSSFDLMPDDRRVLYQTSIDAVTGDFAALKKTHKTVEYGHGVGKTSQLWSLDLETWKSEKIRDDGRVIRDFKVSPDGKRLALITTPDETVITFEGKSRVEVFDLKSKETTVVPDRCFRAEAASPYGWLEHLAWNAKSNAVAFNVVFDGHPAEIVIASEGKTAWTSRKLARSPNIHVRGYGSPLAWFGDEVVYYLGEEKGRVRIVEANLAQGDKHHPLDESKGDIVVESFSSASPTTFRRSQLRNDATHTPDIYLGNTRLTNVNPQVDTWKLPKISTVSWKSKDGTAVEGILELPPDHKEGTKVPLIVHIHGGPTTADRLHMQYWIYGRTLLSAKGYAVLCPNYRGSTGYGDKFLTQLVGNENDLDVADILSGVSMLVEKGIADPERLGVMGWSNGGYLTNCILTHTTRFKAASSGAGIVDTVMEWGANDEPAYAVAFKKGLPWNQSEVYKKTSPTYSLDKIRTPTLIHVGGADERCPPIHSKMLHRALKEYVKVPTELLVYPGEPHGLTKYSNRRAKMEWDVAWFERWILDKPRK